jgi:hypothetical protein
VFQIELSDLLVIGRHRALDAVQIERQPDAHDGDDGHHAREAQGELPGDVQVVEGHGRASRNLVPASGGGISSASSQMRLKYWLKMGNMGIAD